MTALTSAPITVVKRSELQMFPSERLTDNDDGGGMPIGTPLTGADNELFNPITGIERINGGLSGRHVYAGVRRVDDVPLLGAFVALTKPPVDPYVSYLLFKARFGEERKEAMKRIESYSVGSVESNMTLLSTQPAGSKIIKAYQRTDLPPPLVGDRYQLKQDMAGYPAVDQYIQVTKVSSQVQTFASGNGGDIKRLVVTMQITQRLNHDYIGVNYPIEGYANSACKIRETSVVDAGNYYGVKPLADVIDKNLAKLRVSSIFEKIIPTADVDIPLNNLNAAGDRQAYFDAAQLGASGVVTQVLNTNLNLTTEFFLGNGITPDSLEITCTSGSDITDEGGALMRDGAPIGTVDYGESSLRFFPGQNIGLVSADFRPSVASSSISDSAQIAVTINNRSKIYTIMIDPIPNRGSLVVSYRAQGKRYVLRDFGDGKLKGVSQAHGTAYIDFNTGSVSITCGALPDVGSSIIFTWGNNAKYYNRSDVNATNPASVNAKLVFYLNDQADADNINFAWSGGSATCDASGNITGDVTGKYYPTDRKVEIDVGTGLSIPSAGFSITTSYQASQAPSSMSFQNPARNPDGTVTVLLGPDPIKPKSVRMEWIVEVNDFATSGLSSTLINNWHENLMYVTDDGAGNLVDAQGNSQGTIDYATRVINVNADTTVKIPKPKYKQVWIGFRFAYGGTIASYPPGTVQITPNGSPNPAFKVPIYRNVFDGYEYISAPAMFPLSSASIRAWFNDTSPASAISETVSNGFIEIDLSTNFSESIASKSLRFNFGSKQYYDKNGTIYTDLNPATGQAVLAGTVDYADQKITLTSWAAGSAVAVTSMATTVNAYPVDSVVFSAPAAPIRPSGLTLRATAMDGVVITVTSDPQGEFNSAYTRGTIDYEYGVVEVEFGELVVAAGNEAESWYSIDAVTPDGSIWKPKHVIAETLTFSAVAYRKSTVDSSIVKIDTVRLPQDGLVPIFRADDTILITNSEKEDIGSAHTAGQTVNLSRSDVDKICVTDANGKPVLADWWDYDLTAGTITWSTPLDLSAYAMPIFVSNAYQELNKAVSTDIDGTIDLLHLPRRNYPKENTFVSSCLLHGNLQVRFSVPFSQRNWNGEWSDELIGTAPLNRLNTTAYPIALTDDGAITERWLIKFTGSSTFELYGERLGFVMTGDTLTDLQPINPFTGKPYMTILKESFGNQAPWSVQDVIRFNTWGTLMSFWALRANQPTNVPVSGSDSFTTCIFGDTNLA